MRIFGRHRTPDVYRDVAAVRAGIASLRAILAGADLIRAHTAGRVLRARTMPSHELAAVADRRALADLTLPAINATALVRTERSN